MKNNQKNTDVKFAIICIVVIVAFALFSNGIGMFVSNKENEDFLYEIEETVYKAENLEDLNEYTKQFSIENKENDIVTNIEIEQEKQTENYTNEELMLVAKVIAAEAGSDSVSDRCNELVGAVIINRVNHDSFPNTIEEVIYAPGQYSTASILDEIIPDERDIENARRALEGEIDCPSDVVWQANFPQCAWGTTVKVYEKIETPYGTMYFCHYGE